MKQFNVQEYLENPNKKIITRDGKSARIICTDRVCSTHPVLALLIDDKIEEVYQYTSQGEYYPNASSPHDLFFAPEKKEGWLSIYRMDDGDIVLGRIYSSKEVAESMAKKRGIGPYYVATTKIEWEE